MNVSSRSISSDGSSFVVLRPQPIPGPTASSSPSSGECTSDSDSDWDSGSEYCPSEELDDSDAPSLRYTRDCRAPVTRQQAIQIRNFHKAALRAQRKALRHTVPLVMFQGSQTPVLQAQGEADFQFAEPLVQANWIDPYGLPSDAIDAHLPVRDIPIDHKDYPGAFHALANSGHNYLTDFPVVDSPRKSGFQISAMLRSERLLEWTSGSRETMSIGQQIPLPNVQKVNTRAVTFVPFSYTNVWQPRTEAARAAGDDVPVSPRAMPPRSAGFGAR